MQRRIGPGRRLPSGSSQEDRRTARSYRLEGARFLREVEGLKHVVRGRVPSAQRGQPIPVLYELQNRGMVVGRRVKVALLRIGRDDQTGDSEPVPVLVDLRRSDVVVEPPEVVPRYEDRGRVPVCPAPDVVYDAVRHRVLTCLYVRRGVLVPSGRADYPRYIAERSLLHVGQELGGCDEVRLGLRRPLDVLEILEPGGGRAVHLPGDSLLVQLLEYRREADRLRNVVVDDPSARARDQREMVG